MDITHADVTEKSAADGANRRRFLGAGIVGAALAAVAARPVSAQTDDSVAESTTTAPPARPTAADTDLLVFVQQVELTAMALYRAALGSDVDLDDAMRANFDALRLHHDAYAKSVAGLVGGVATNSHDEALYDELVDGFEQGSAAEVAKAAHDLENSLVATHTALLSELEGTNASSLVASIQIVEARHAAVLAKLAGLDPVADADAFLVTPDIEPLTPADDA